MKHRHPFFLLPHTKTKTLYSPRVCSKGASLYRISSLPLWRALPGLFTLLSVRHSPWPPGEGCGSQTNIHKHVQTCSGTFCSMSGVSSDSCPKQRSKKGSAAFHRQYMISPQGCSAPETPVTLRVPSMRPSISTTSRFLPHKIKLIGFTFPGPGKIQQVFSG